MSSAREEVWNQAGVGTRCFDVLTSSSPIRSLIASLVSMQGHYQVTILETRTPSMIHRTTLGNPGRR